MKCLILAAGYATRLYPLTENFPKPLLDVKGKPIIEWLIDDLNNLGVIDEYYLVTNHKFYEHFVSWNKYPNLKVIDDGTLTNETRLGAVKDIDLVIKNENINDDLLIMAGDNVLDFSLKNFIEYQKDKNMSSVMRFYQDDINLLRKTGVAEINKEDVITSMEEKPNEPKSNWTIPPFYIISKQDLKYINEAIKDGINVDAPGSFIAYLAKKTKVYAHLMDGHRIDIGDLDTYNKINK
ncbi:MAG: nucleotidyltransferase family protein [Firmicutes bacterium]|nr:nucleotidyltransferase family protein [Candidatus Colivicinus equi]